MGLGAADNEIFNPRSLNKLVAEDSCWGFNGQSRETFDGFYVLVARFMQDIWKYFAIEICVFE